VYVKSNVFIFGLVFVLIYFLEFKFFSMELSSEYKSISSRSNIWNSESLNTNQDILLLPTFSNGFPLNLLHLIACKA